jgi:hypothetical protein
MLTQHTYRVGDSIATEYRAVSFYRAPQPRKVRECVTRQATQAERDAWTQADIAHYSDSTARGQYAPHTCQANTCHTCQRGATALGLAYQWDYEGIAYRTAKAEADKWIAEAREEARKERERAKRKAKRDKVNA